MKNHETSDFNRKSLTSIPFGGPVGIMHIFSMLPADPFRGHWRVVWRVVFWTMWGASDGMQTFSATRRRPATKFPPPDGGLLWGCKKKRTEAHFM